MTIKTCVTFSPAILAKVDEMALKRGVTRSDVIRHAVADYLVETISVASYRRLCTVSEYNQLVLDIVLDENAPDRREGIIRLVLDRMEQFHAAR